MNLESVYLRRSYYKVLFDLLKERKPDQSISHRRMPTFEEHEEFVRSRPYRAWFIIQDDGRNVGAIYLTRQAEIGIFIFEAYQGKGYASWAVREVMKRYQQERFLANINPQNGKSIEFFERMGARHIQNTYEIGGSNDRTAGSIDTSGCIPPSIWGGSNDRTAGSIDRGCAESNALALSAAGAGHVCQGNTRRRESII